MDISIVIVSYNVRYFLDQCILSVQSSSENFQIEIIVVDNNSSDDTCDFLRNKYPFVKLIDNKSNLGFSKANNQGVEIAQGTYVLILNPDTVLGEDTLKKVFDFATQKKDLGILGVKLIDGSGNYLPESKRSIPTPSVAFKKIFGLTKKQRNKYYADHLNEDESGKVDVLVGAFMFLEREIYSDVGGFDPEYFMYGEDIDLSYKVLKSGYQNYYFSETQVIHYKGESTQKDYLNLSHFYNAMKIFYKKHFKKIILYNVFVNIGLKCWFVLSYFENKIASKKEVKISSVLLVGEDNKLLRFLKANYKNVFNESLVSIENINELVKNECVECVIFDNSSIANSEIITAMQKLKQLNISFKIKPKGTDYLIGSSSSKFKGEVIKF